MESDPDLIHPWLQLATMDFSKVYDALNKYKKQQMNESTKAGLPEKTTGLTFNEAMKAMHSGFKVRLPEWTGYWFIEDGETKLLTRTGDILNTPDFKKFGSRDDWEIAIQGMGFDFAVLALNAGKLVARAKWGKTIFIFLRPAYSMSVGYALSEDVSLPSFLKNLPSSLKSWLKQNANKKDASGNIADQDVVPIQSKAYVCSIDIANRITNGWVPAQDDLLATDWEVIQVPEWQQSNDHPGLVGRMVAPNQMVTNISPTEQA